MKFKVGDIIYTFNKTYLPYGIVDGIDDNYYFIDFPDRLGVVPQSSEFLQSLYNRIDLSQFEKLLLGLNKKD